MRGTYVEAMSGKEALAGEATWIDLFGAVDQSRTTPEQGRQFIHRKGSKNGLYYRSKVYCFFGGLF